MLAKKSGRPFQAIAVPALLSLLSAIIVKAESREEAEEIACERYTDTDAGFEVDYGSFDIHCCDELPAEPASREGGRS